MTIFNITGAVGVFATYAAMTAAGSDLADNAVYCTFGRSAEEDGGFGFWRYDSASTATANDGTLLAVDGGGPGRFFRLDDGTVSPKWFGAKGDGMTNDRSDIEAADATGRGIALPSGSFLVSSNLTISSPTFFAYGAKLSIPTGVTVTLNFRPEAGLWQIFDCAGTGNVSFPQNAADEVYPEWWGVVVNSAAAASFNLTAIGKAITSGGHAVQFQCASYWISARLHVTTSHITLRGYSRFWLGVWAAGMTGRPLGAAWVGSSL